MVNDDLEKIIERLIKNIFNNRSIAHVSDDMYSHFVDQLWDAVVKGYGADIVDVDEESIESSVLKYLNEDVIHFSAAKDDVMNRAIFRELVDASGEFRPFNEFKKAASQIINDHNGAWLKAEYNFAVASSQMTRRWHEVEAGKDVLPLLQYETVGDDRVRPAHRELEGVIRPVDDEFWEWYYPPNGWLCRCTVRQLADGVVTENYVTPDDIPKMFKVNFGKLKKVFPPDHPYYGAAK